MSILIGIGVYFALGVVVLVILDLATRRIRSHLLIASQEAKDKLAVSGSFVGNKESIVLTIGALWLFWPLVIFSALKRGNSNGEKK